MTIFELLGKITVSDTEALKSIDNVEKKAESSSGKMNTSFSKVGGLLKGALLGGAVAVGTALGAMGIAGIKSAAELESATAKMKASLGTTQEEADRLGKVALDVFRNNFGGSITEAAGMVGELRKQLGDMSDEQTQKLTQMGATISNLYGVDFQQTITTAKTLTDQFGISNEQAFDLMTTGFQKGLNSSGDFLDSINEYSTQFANGGASADEFFGIMQSGLQGGMLGTDKAADAFKEFRLRIQDGSKLTSQSLQQIGIDSDDLAQKISSGQMTAADAFQLVITKLGETEDPMVRMQAGAGLIGSQFEDLGDTAVSQLSMTTTSLESMAGATDAAGAAAYDNLGDNWQTLMRAFQTAATEGFGGAVGPANEFVKFLITQVPLVTDALKTAGTFIQTWAPVVIGYLEPLKEFFTGLWTASKFAWENIGKPVFTALIPFFKLTFSAIGDTLTIFGKLLQGDFVGAFEVAKDGAVRSFTLLREGIVNIVTGIWGLIKGPLETFGNNVVDVATQVKDDFVEKFTALKDGVWKVVVDLWAYITQPLTAFKQGVINAAIDVYNGFKDNFEDLNNKVVEIIKGLWNGVKENLNTFVTNVVTTITDIPERIKDVGANIVNQIVSGITGKKAELQKESGSLMQDGVVQPIKDTADIHSPSKVLYTIGQQVVQGLAGGISDPAENTRVQAASALVAKNLTSSFLDALGITQPENEWTLAGRDVIKGFLEGMKSQWPEVEGFLQRVRDARPDVNVPMPNASASVTPSVGVPQPQASSAVSNLVNIVIPQFAAAVGRVTAITMPEFQAAGSYTAYSAIQNAQNEASARRIALDTELAQRQGSLNYTTQLDALRAQGALATQQNVNATLAGTVAWIGSSLGSAVTWVGSALGSAVTWVGGALTSVAGFMGDVMVGLGSSLLNLAGSQIPWLGASMEAMAGGPIAVLVAFLTSLIGETWQFQEIIKLATSIVKPLIGILGNLITAIWPLIQVISQYLQVGFQALGWVISNVITPVFRTAAQIIAGIWNALARAINWALGWLGVHINEVNVSAGPVNSSFAGSVVGAVKDGYAKQQQQRSAAISSAVSMVQNHMSKPKTPSYNPPKPKAPSYKAPLQPKPKAPSAPKLGAPGGSKTPGMSKTPGYKPGGSYSGGSGSYDSGSDLSRGSGGTKVSEITGPTRDFLADAFASFAALPTLVGIQSRTYDLLAAKLGGGAINVQAPALGGIGSLTINLEASGDMNYDLNQIARQLEPYLVRRFMNGSRGTGRKK